MPLFHQRIDRKRVRRVRSKDWLIRKAAGGIEYSFDEGLTWRDLPEQDILSLALRGEVDLIETIQRLP